MAAGFPAVCVFVHDDLSTVVLERLNARGTHVVALRSAGFNHVDLPAADRLGMVVVRVPAYSPRAVAEHATGLILTLNRRIHRAAARPVNDAACGRVYAVTMGCGVSEQTYRSCLSGGSRIALIKP